MRFRPPKGIRPPQLEGKRTGRPKGSKNSAKAWSDCLWGFKNACCSFIPAPNASAALWREYATDKYDELEAFLIERGMIPG